MENNFPEFIYLATPYTHKDKQMMIARFKMVNIEAAKLMAAGNHVFSPISHTHPIAVVGDLPRGWEYWKEYDRRILKICTKIVVLRLPGWDISTGVQAEIKVGEEYGIPIEYIDYDLKEWDSILLEAYSYNR